MRTATEVQRNARQPHHHPPAPIIGGINEHVHPERTHLPERAAHRPAGHGRSHRPAPRRPDRVLDLCVGWAYYAETPTTESLSAALRTTLTPETRARATAVAGTIRTDGATVAAKLLLDAVSQERPPAST